MALLPQIQYPDIVGNSLSAYQNAYSLGEAHRKRNLLLEIGNALASGSSVPAAATAPAQPTPRAATVSTAPTSTTPAASALAINAADFIKKQEGFTPRAAWDVRQYSSGYGTKGRPGEVVDQAEAERRLNAEISPIDTWINQNVKVPLSPGQRTALTSFAYNLGTDDLNRLLPDINAGAWDRVGSRMLTFNKALNARTGRLEPLTGLTRRRAEESALLTGGAPTPAVAAPQSSGLTAAATTAFRGGDIQTGLALQERDITQAKEARERAEAKQKEMWGYIGDLALAADTPEKWSRAIQAARANGLNVEGLDDYSARNVVLAHSGRMKTALDYANREQKVYEVGGNLVQNVDGKMQTIYSAPPAPQKAFQLQAADRKELFESDEAVQAGQNVLGALDRAIELNKQAYSGPLAQTRGYLASQFGAEGGIATEELQNVVLGQVLDSLKATFGAAPTEGERQILVEVQGSVDKAPAVREKIFQRAQEAARRRIQFNREKSNALRSGEYFQPGYSPTAAPAAVPAPSASEPVSVNTPEEAMKLPPGTQFRTPDGRLKVRP